ncbi:MAG: SPASM domain-containing protein, partial [Anaerolineae bacterium]|nr:SPASM domain-containing protein [Anaerolineae bacterium]
WLHITNACNLDCPYCYVRKSSARMTEEIGIRALARIFDTARQNGFRQVKLKYAGGEATLHFALIRHLHQKANALARETGIRLREVVLSNGTCLCAEDADWFAASGVKLMISLDGVGETHNRLRADRKGRDTFARIEQTVERVLLPRGIRPDITITVTRLNASGVADAVRWALERDLPVSLNFYRQNILSASREELALEEETIIEGMLKAYAVFEEFLPKRFFLNGLLDRVQIQAHTQTCGVGTSYLVITHEGKLAQCQMYLEHTTSATLDTDLLLSVANGFIRQVPVDAKNDCRDCTFRYRCTGGCPLETFRVTGRWDTS